MIEEEVGPKGEAPWSFQLIKSCDTAILPCLGLLYSKSGSALADILYIYIHYSLQKYFTNILTIHFTYSSTYIHTMFICKINYSYTI